MSQKEIEDVIRFVADIAHCRHPWLSTLRAPTQAEFAHAASVIERLPTPAEVIDRTPTVVLVNQ